MRVTPVNWLKTLRHNQTVIALSIDTRTELLIGAFAQDPSHNALC